MVALLLGLLVALALLRHDLAVSAVAGAVATVAVTLAGQALNNWLSARSWGQHHDSDLQHVLHIRLYVRGEVAEHLAELTPILAERLGGVRPALTAIGVASLATPDTLVEIEAVARVRTT